jgi:hypothetical protein
MLEWLTRGSFPISLPELSNSGCRPGKARGSPPFTLGVFTISLATPTKTNPLSDWAAIAVPLAHVSDGLPVIPAASAVHQAVTSSVAFPHPNTRSPAPPLLV